MDCNSEWNLPNVLGVLRKFKAPLVSSMFKIKYFSSFYGSIRQSGTWQSEFHSHRWHFCPSCQYFWLAFFKAMKITCVSMCILVLLANNFRALFIEKSMMLQFKMYHATYRSPKSLYTVLSIKSLRLQLL